MSLALRTSLGLALAAFAAGPVLRADETLPLMPTAATQWDSARDADRLSREFVRYAVRDDTDATNGRIAAWGFHLREGGFADVFIHQPIPRRFDAIRLRVRCRGDALRLAVKIGDASGAEWTAPPVDLAARSDWQTVVWPWEQWQVAGWSSDPNGTLDFPTRHLAVIAFDVRPGPDYALDVAAVDAVLPDRPQLTVTGFEAPERARAGAPIRAQVRFRLEGTALCDRAELALVDADGHRIVQALSLPSPPTQLVTGSEATVDVRLPIPRYAFGGTYQWQLNVGDAVVRLDGRSSEEALPTVDIEARKANRTAAAVRLHNGAPALHINGRPVSGMTYMAYGPSVKVFRDFANAGVSLFSFSATPTESGYGLARTAWTAPDTYDFSQMDERALMVLEANPDAYFFPRIYLHAPQWWSEQHPDDIVLQQNPDGTIAPFIHSGGKPAPSWASEAWREDTVRGIERFVRHIEESPYADRVIGYHIASGTTEEWMMWGANEGEWVDYSPANQRKFRAWLKDRYGDDARLQEAWSDPNARIDTAAIPPRADRERCTMGYLRDPAQEQAVIDFYEYNSWMVADTIRYFAHETKRITHDDKIVGVFYGYLLQLIGEQRMQNAGHLALDDVLSCPDVDFMTSPTSYMFRDLGTGTSHFMSLTDSVKLHGKLWFDENDIRTSLSPGEVGGWGKPEDIDGDILQQDRELGNVIANGVAQWWFDVGANRYDDDRLMAHIARLRQAADDAMDCDRTPADEIAVLVDGWSLARMQVGAPITSWLLAQQIPELARIGAPVGYYSLGDLPGLPPKRMYVFLDCLAPTAEVREAVTRLHRDGRVLVFIGPAGLYRDGNVDPAAMSELCGVNLRLSAEPAVLRCTWSGPDGPVEFGAPQPFGPVAVAEDANAEVMGRLADGRPGLVIRRHDGWTAVHSAAPALPAALLRELAGMAGVHLYSPGDVVWASAGLLTVSVNEAGDRTIRLPRRCTVSDLVTGETVATDAARFDATFPAKGTRTFRLR